MEGGSDVNMDKSDEILLLGFRFHPTDEELVSFYLKKKIQQTPISIEIIRQLDIYKFDPWDLPKLASTGETEWYFYCPRDRKYRNSARPNRVTSAGFWKATGTDRPIYSSEGTKCVGLKKSLVFYRGRAARGVKTDWMMHEFRLPSLADPSVPKRPIDKNIMPINDLQEDQFDGATGAVSRLGASNAWCNWARYLLWDATGASFTFCFIASRGSTCKSVHHQQIWLPAFQGQQPQHFQKPNNTQDGSSCKVISFNYRPRLVQKGPIMLPFQTQPSQKPAHATPHIFDPLLGNPEQVAVFVIDSSADINAGISCTNQESSMIKPENTLSVNGEWEAPGRLNFPFDLGADSSDDWNCNIPWESFLSPAVSC